MSVDAVRWDYWCPHAGTHVIHRDELHVGLFSDAGGEGVLLLEAAVIPPMVDMEGRTSQPEPIARAVRAALQQADLADWVRAHRGRRFPWPSAACPECGSRTSNGCGASWHDSAPASVVGGCAGHGVDDCPLCDTADNPSSVESTERAEAETAGAECIAFPVGEPLYIAKRVVWSGRPGNPESRIVGDIKPDPGHEVAVIIEWRTDREGVGADGEPVF